MKSRIKPLFPIKIQNRLVPKKQAINSSNSVNDGPYTFASEPMHTVHSNKLMTNHVQHRFKQRDWETNIGDNGSAPIKTLKLQHFTSLQECSSFRKQPQFHRQIESGDQLELIDPQLKIITNKKASITNQPIKKSTESEINNHQSIKQSNKQYGKTDEIDTIEKQIGDMDKIIKKLEKQLTWKDNQIQQLKDQNTTLSLAQQSLENLYINSLELQTIQIKTLKQKLESQSNTTRFGLQAEFNKMPTCQFQQHEIRNLEQHYKNTMKTLREQFVKQRQQLQSKNINNLKIKEEEYNERINELKLTNQEKQKNLEGNIMEIKVQKSEKQKQLNMVIAQLSNQVKKKEEHIRQYSILQEKYQQLKEIKFRQELSLQSQNHELEQVKSVLASKIRQLQNMNNQLQNLKLSYSNTQQSVKASASSLNQSQRNYDELMKQLEVKQYQIKTLKQHVREFEQGNEQANEKWKVTEKQNKELKQKIKQSQIQALDEICQLKKEQNDNTNELLRRINNYLLKIRCLETEKQALFTELQQKCKQIDQKDHYISNLINKQQEIQLSYQCSFDKLGQRLLVYEDMLNNFIDHEKPEVYQNKNQYSLSTYNSHELYNYKTQKGARDLSNTLLYPVKSLHQEQRPQESVQNDNHACSLHQQPVPVQNDGQQIESDSQNKFHQNQNDISSQSSDNQEESNQQSAVNANKVNQLNLPIIDYDEQQSIYSGELSDSKNEYESEDQLRNRLKKSLIRSQQLRDANNLRDWQQEAIEKQYIINQLSECIDSYRQLIESLKQKIKKQQSVQQNYREIFEMFSPKQYSHEELITSINQFINKTKLLLEVNQKLEGEIDEFKTENKQLNERKSLYIRELKRCGKMMESLELKNQELENRLDEQIEERLNMEENLRRISLVHSTILQDKVRMHLRQLNSKYRDMMDDNSEKELQIQENQKLILGQGRKLLKKQFESEQKYGQQAQQAQEGQQGQKASVAQQKQETQLDETDLQQELKLKFQTSEAKIDRIVEVVSEDKEISLDMV